MPLRDQFPAGVIHAANTSQVDDQRPPVEYGGSRLPRLVQLRCTALGQVAYQQETECSELIMHVVHEAVCRVITTARRFRHWQFSLGARIHPSSRPKGGS